MKTKFNYSYNVKGMHCTGCEIYIKDELEKIEGVLNVTTDLETKLVKFSYSGHDEISDIVKKVNSEISKFGYELVDELEVIDGKSSDLFRAFIISFFIAILFIYVARSDLSSRVEISQIDFVGAFLLGVLASFSSCMAVVGGLVLSLSSSFAKQKKFLAISLFHLSRIVSFFLLGGVIGVIGDNLVLGKWGDFTLNLILFLSMAVMGLNLLEIFTFTKKFQLHFPKRFATLNKIPKKNVNLLTPILLGTLTFILPCPFTQNMELLALKQGSFNEGSILMLSFALGTLPMLLVISFASVKFSNFTFFFKVAGFLVLFFAIMNLLSAIASIGLIEPVFTF